MSCIIQAKGPATSNMLCVSKGASEIMKSSFETIPPFYDDCHMSFSRQGCRVLALGHKSIRSLTSRQMKTIDRNDIESGLIFSGFLILRCPLKHDSLMTIKTLRQSSHKVVMITGDHALTACSVASESLICVKPVIILVYNGSESGNKTNANKEISKNECNSEIIKDNGSKNIEHHKLS